MNQEQETKTSLDREEYLRKISEGKINFNRYLNAYSDSNYIGHEPKNIKVLNHEQNQIKLEINIDEEENYISIKTSDNYKISEQTLDYIKTLLGNYYADSKYVSLYFNEELCENINTLINELESNVSTIEDRYETTPFELNPSYGPQMFNDEISLHIDKEAKKAYVKFPVENIFIQEKLDKIGKDIIENIGEDCEIYLINNAGEVYETITMNQLLGKEDRNTIGYDIYIINRNNRRIDDSPWLFIDNTYKSMEVKVTENMTSSEYDEILEKIESLHQKCNKFCICKTEKGTINGEEVPLYTRTFEDYFESGYEKLKEKLILLKKEASKTTEEHKTETNENSTNDDYVSNWDSYINTVKGNRKDERGFDYNRYFAVTSTYDSINYEPKRFIITDPNTKAKKLEMIINEENLSIEIKTYNNSKISEESVTKIKSIMSLFFADTWATELIFNGKSYLRQERYDEFMSLIESKAEPGVKDEYQMMSQRENISDFEEAIDNEVQLHISQNNAYVKLPKNIKSAKEKLAEIGNAIRNVIGDNNKIYVINSAGEIYAQLTLNQLLGKEEISEDIAKRGFAGLKEFKTPDTIHIQTDEMDKQFSIAISADATASDYEELLKMINENSGVYAVYNRILLFSEKENGDIHKKMGYLKEGQEEIITEIERLRDEALKREQPENLHIDQNNEVEFEEPVNVEILNNQNALIIEKDSDRVDKYIYDAKTKEKVHEFTLANDKYNMYTPGTYVNIVEYTTNVLTSIEDKYKNSEIPTFITEDQEELFPLEAMERAYAHCSTGGGMSVGDEYVDLFRNKGKKVKYEDIEEMYSPSSTKSYNKGKTKLEKGLYMNKELIEEFFKTLKVRIRVNENQDTTGVGQMGR